MLSHVNPTDPVYDAAWQMPRLGAGPRSLKLTISSTCRPAFTRSVMKALILFRQRDAAPRHFDSGDAYRPSSGHKWRVAQFIGQGGYTTPSLWLSDGWGTVQAEGWEAPGYWRLKDGQWHVS